MSVADLIISGICGLIAFIWCVSHFQDRRRLHLGTLLVSLTLAGCASVGAMWLLTQ